MTVLSTLVGSHNLGVLHWEDEPPEHFGFKGQRLNFRSLTGLEIETYFTLEVNIRFIHMGIHSGGSNLIGV